MKKLLLFFAILGFAASNANAGEFTVADTHSREYLEYNGYSSSAIELVERSHARAKGEAFNGYIEGSLYRNQGGWFGKFLRYLDPAADTDTFMNHDINYHSRFDDL